MTRRRGSRRNVSWRAANVFIAVIMVIVGSWSGRTRCKARSQGRLVGPISSLGSSLEVPSPLPSDHGYGVSKTEARGGGEANAKSIPYRVYRDLYPELKDISEWGPRAMEQQIREKTLLMKKTIAKLTSEHLQRFKQDPIPVLGSGSDEDILSSLKKAHERPAQGFYDFGSGKVEGANISSTSTPSDDEPMQQMAVKFHSIDSNHSAPFGPPDESENSDTRGKGFRRQLDQKYYILRSLIGSDRLLRKEAYDELDEEMQSWWGSRMIRPFDPEEKAIYLKRQQIRRELTSIGRSGGGHGPPKAKRSQSYDIDRAAEGDEQLFDVDLEEVSSDAFSDSERKKLQNRKKRPLQGKLRCDPGHRDSSVLKSSKRLAAPVKPKGKARRPGKGRGGDAKAFTSLMKQQREEEMAGRSDDAEDVGANSEATVDSEEAAKQLFDPKFRRSLMDKEEKSKAGGKSKGKIEEEEEDDEDIEKLFMQISQSDEGEILGGARRKDAGAGDFSPVDKDFEEMEKKKNKKKRGDVITISTSIIRKYNYTLSSNDEEYLRLKQNESAASPSLTELEFQHDLAQISQDEERSSLDTEQKNLIKSLKKGQFVIDGEIFNEYGEMIRPEEPVKYIGGAVPIVYQMSGFATPLINEFSWMDLAMIRRNNKNGRYTVRVKDTYEARFVGLANKTLHNVEAKHIREKPYLECGWYQVLNEKGIKLAYTKQAAENPMGFRPAAKVKQDEIVFVDEIDEESAHILGPVEGWTKIVDDSTLKPKMRPSTRLKQFMDTSTKWISKRTQHVRLRVEDYTIFMIRAIPPNQVPKGKVLLLCGHERRAEEWEKSGFMHRMMDMGYAVVAIDLPGEGSSQGEHALGGRAVKSQWLRVVIECLALEPVFLVAPHSSTWYALPFALYNPTKIIGYVGLSPLSWSNHTDEDYVNAPFRAMIFRGAHDKRAAIAVRKIRMMPKMQDIVVPNRDYDFYYKDMQAWEPRVVRFMKELHEDDDETAANAQPEQRAVES